MEENIVGIRFQKFGKMYHFRAEGDQEIQTGDFVIVDTSRGRQIGEVVQLVDENKVEREGYLKPITRVATPRDLVLRQVWEFKEEEALDACRSMVKELKIKGVKIISAEYTFDGKRLSFLYGSEGDENINLSELLNSLKQLFRRIKIDLRKIGPRDVAKILGGMGVCGMGVRCCSQFLTEFHPISIRMAKTQGVSLAPVEITGMCGRLRCCLYYEYDHYVEARKELPREKKRVTTPDGHGRVVSVSPLIKTLLVRLDEGGLKEFTLDELESSEAPSEVAINPEPDLEPAQSKPARPQRRRDSSRRRTKRRK
jgi:cell fate regulator YaaT (PSP1 superfamily)